MNLNRMQHHVQSKACLLQAKSAHVCSPSALPLMTQTFGAAHALAAVDWQEVVPANAAAAAGSYMAQPVPASDLAGWRLLSGHESGQVLLWQVLGLNTRPGGRSIQLLCVIMEPRQIGCVVMRGSCCGRQAGGVRSAMGRQNGWLLCRTSALSALLLFGQGCASCSHFSSGH